MTPPRLPLRLHHGCLLLLLVFQPLAAASAAEWARYIAPDKSVSMHYPTGWVATVDGAAVTFASAATGEDLQMAPLANEADKTPRQLAEDAIEAFRAANMPDLIVRAWRDGEDPARAVSLQTAYTQDGQRFIGDLLVVKGDGNALLVAYTAPESAYNPRRGVVLLQGLVQSLAEGEASPAPDLAVPPLADRQMELTAQAFLFVVEFALGTPLAVTDERGIIDEMKGLLADLAPADRAPYDEYPRMMATILSLQEDQVESVRKKLEATVREQLEAGAEHPSMRAIQEQLTRSRQVVAEADPPLTELQATAFGESIAYGQLLYTSPQASPEEVDPAAVAGWRQHLIALWAGLDPANRQGLQRLPGVWMVDRTMLRVGSQEEQATVRQELKTMAPDPAGQVTPAPDQPQPAAAGPAATAAGAGGGKPAPWHSALGRELTRRYLNNQMFMRRLEQRRLSIW